MYKHCRTSSHASLVSKPDAARISQRPAISHLLATEALAMAQVRKERGSDPIWAEAWQWRENLQRAIDGCHTTDEMSSAGLAAYSELKGPNMPLSCGYSVRPPCPAGYLAYI